LGFNTSFLGRDSFRYLSLLEKWGQTLIKSFIGNKLSVAQQKHKEFVQLLLE
jgi:hypothetical protein